MHTLTHPPTHPLKFPPFPFSIGPSTTTVFFFFPFHSQNSLASSSFFLPPARAASSTTTPHHHHRLPPPLVAAAHHRSCSTALYTTVGGRGRGGRVVRNTKRQEEVVVEAREEVVSVGGGAGGRVLRNRKRQEEVVTNAWEDTQQVGGEGRGGRVRRNGKRQEEVVIEARDCPRGGQSPGLREDEAQSEAWEEPPAVCRGQGRGQRQRDVVVDREDEVEDDDLQSEAAEDDDLQSEVEAEDDELQAESEEDEEESDLGDDEVDDGPPVGPQDRSLLKDFRNHVAAAIWGEDCVALLRRWLGVTKRNAKAVVCCGGVTFDWLWNTFHELEDDATDDKVDYCVRAYLLYLLGTTLFVDKIGIRVNVSYLALLSDLTLVSTYAWGVGALRFLYRQLGQASRCHVKGMGGYTTLLEAWIQEHFPMSRHAMNPNYTDDLPRATRWHSRREATSATTVRYREMLDDVQATQVIEKHNTLIQVVLLPTLSFNTQPETNSFHFRFGEMTITLDDVSYLIGVPVEGLAVHAEVHGKEDCVALLRRWLGVTKRNAKAAVCCGGVTFDWLWNTFHELEDDAMDDRVDYCVRAYLLYLLGTTLFVYKTGIRVNVSYLALLSDLTLVSTYAWGVGALRFLYRQLGQASRCHVKGMGGYTTLLETEQAIALESEESRHYDGGGTMNALSYLPDRVLRQFDLVQFVLGPPLAPLRGSKGSTAVTYSVVYQYTDALWQNWRDHLLHEDKRVLVRFGVPWESHHEYLPWFRTVSYLRVSPNHGEGQFILSVEERNAAALALLDGFLGGGTISTAPCDMWNTILQVWRILSGAEAGDLTTPAPTSRS
ncbi:hypothetical protein RHGRI_029193 [Rhododendron griersonianum]|uniref:Aminotransferase-like plant mobile domain-containing protein n=1 Tax=Rhododendron griersonianum TaxID=479676 RepID=A0AAV6IID3_9ERIC|nr:hypothetical protein RHGRI_029193 [Rhododendron griersonianum]